MSKETEMSNSIEIARLTERMENMKEDVDIIKTQLDEIRMALTYFKGNWKAMGLLYMFLLGAGGLIMRIYMLWGK